MSNRAFARRYGFRDKPERIRVRFLDPACAIAPERLGLDLTLDSAAFAVLDPPVERVFITENEVRSTILIEIKQRIFGGSGLSLVRCLVEQGEMSETEIRELGEWIESHRKGG